MRLRVRAGSSLVLCVLCAFVCLTREYQRGKDPFKVLGVPRDASNDDIRKAYKKLAMKWHPDKNPSKVAKERFIEVQGAYETLTDPEKRRQFDVHGSHSHSQERAGYHNYDAERSEHSTHFRHHFHQHFEPPRPEPIKSATMTLTAENFVTSVLGSSQPWLVQVYSSWWNMESKVFARSWEAIAEEVEGVVQCGRVNAQEQASLAAALAERDHSGRHSYGGGLPALLAFPEKCSSLECVVRYRGPRTKKAVIRFVSRRLLRLPFVPTYSDDKLEDDFLRSAPSHKVRLVLFIGAKGGVPLLFRLAARDLKLHCVCAAARGGRRYGVTSSPTLVIFKEPGTTPIVHRGSLRKAAFRKILEKHKFHELAQLHDATQQELGCHAQSFSKLWEHSPTRPCFCAILVGQQSSAVQNARKVLREVQSSLSEAAGAAGATFRGDSLRLLWLNSEQQGPYCRYLLRHNSTAMAACRSTFWPFTSVWKTENSLPKLVLVRIRQGEGFDDMGSRDEGEPMVGNDDVSRHVAIYEGPIEVKEIIRWLSIVIASSQGGFLHPQFMQDGQKEPRLKAEAWETPEWVAEVLLWFEELAERMGLSLEMMEEVGWEGIMQWLSALIGGIILYGFFSCLRIGKMQAGGQGGQHGGADLQESKFSSTSATRRWQLQSESLKLPANGGPGGDFRVAELRADTAGALLRGGAFVVVLVVREQVTTKGEFEADSNDSSNGSMQLALADFSKVALHFIREPRFQFLMVNAQQHPDWGSCRGCDEQTVDAEGAQLLVWHPRRDKYQALGRYRGGSSAMAVTQLEAVLDGVGQWLPSKWPALST